MEKMLSDESFGVDRLRLDASFDLQFERRRVENLMRSRLNGSHEECKVERRRDSIPSRKTVLDISAGFCATRSPRFTSRLLVFDWTVDRRSRTFSPSETSEGLSENSFTALFRASYSWSTFNGERFVRKLLEKIKLPKKRILVSTAVCTRGHILGLTDLDQKRNV
ncbi:hypothetical protein IQ285_12740 [Burkholderia sp. R-69608]|uniref:hypothetical protein n=1 Tax=Paraburkholderia nemoris TaxID=2793076 RepID=UPI0019140DCB|nr:hypothetical protein [Paraburkholderia nemoris]MBK5148549.1 hypothetical protein [Burkholderia sp. R-69608]